MGDKMSVTISHSGYEKSECETSTCLSNIPNCNLGDPNCAIASYKMNTDKSGLDISLSFSGSDTYVAIGISLDVGMPNTDVYYCQNQDDTIGVQSALSIGYSRPLITEKYISDNGIVENTIATNLTANVYTCRFTRELDVTKTIWRLDMERLTRTFNIEEGRSWNIMMAKGRMSEGRAQYHGRSSADGNTALFRKGFIFTV